MDRLCGRRRLSTAGASPSDFKDASVVLLNEPQSFLILREESHYWHPQCGSDKGIG